MAMDTWTRYDTVTCTTAAARAEVYRRCDKLVTGPCLSLYVGDVEVFRVDLPHVPTGKCHEHWSAIPGKPRLFYPASFDRSHLVELACSNIVRHVPAACAIEGVPAPSRDELEEIAVWARPYLEAL